MSILSFYRCNVPTDLEQSEYLSYAQSLKLYCSCVHVISACTAYIRVEDLGKIFHVEKSTLDEIIHKNYSRFVFA